MATIAGVAPRKATRIARRVAASWMVPSSEARVEDNWFKKAPSQAYDLIERMPCNTYHTHRQRGKGRGKIYMRLKKTGVCVCVCSMPLNRSIPLSLRVY